jgi:hypothetical protein
VVCVPAEMSTIKAFASMVVSCMCMLTWVGGGAGHRLFQVVGKQGACLVCYP